MYICNTRAEFYRFRSKFKGSGIFEHENLTQERQRWFNKARQHSATERVWTQDGCIEIRQKNGARIVMSSSEDLDRL